MFPNEDPRRGTSIPLDFSFTKVPEGEVDRLQSGLAPLDRFLGGGLAFGAVTEWGMPIGRGGRRLILLFLAAATYGRGRQEALRTVWINAPGSGLTVYPPAWCAYGVNLAKMHFITSARPVSQLRQLWLSPLFKVLILDSPDFFSADDLAFVVRQARANRQIIFLLRNYVLSEARGNIWARLRINCAQDLFRSRRYHLRVIRGLSPREMALDLPEGADR